MKRILTTVKFWADAGERAVKTFAQVALVSLGQDAVGVDVFSADWRNVLGLAASAALVSVLTSVASIQAPAMSPASLVPPGV